MFFYPLDFYLKMLFTTIIVETALFAIFVSRRPLRIASAVCFNVFTHVSLHIGFTYAVISGLEYNMYLWLIGEAAILLAEAMLYYLSKSIEQFSLALFWSFVFNISSIVVGQIINFLIL